MQFTNGLAESIMRGEKTQTRRPVKSTESAKATEGIWADQIESVYTNGRLKWMVGKTYAVQPGRGKKAIGHIKITRIRQQRVHDINRVDAVREGFKDMRAFQRKWSDLYDSTQFAWKNNPRVWVIDFHLVQD